MAAKSDQFTFEVKQSKENEGQTKRSILSKIAQLFDPIGFIAPVILVAKIIMQQIWKAELDWDEVVPKEIAEKWINLWSCIAEVEKIKIPRWLGIESDVQSELHGFADSSFEAYGAVIYLRVTKLNGDISCNLLVSKSKVAPLKGFTIPRLELAAAKLLSNLFVMVRNSMEFEHIPYYLWSDNTTALQWINKPLHELKLYVVNRVKRIKENTAIENWRHIRTA